MKDIKSKLVFVTPEYFLDVDYPIVEELNKCHDFLWIITFSRETVSPKFKKESVSEFCESRNVRYEIYVEKYRKRDVRSLFQSYKIINSIRSFDPVSIYFNEFASFFLPFFVRFLLDVDKVYIAIHDVIYHSGKGTILHHLSHFIKLKLFKNYQFFSKSQLHVFRSSNYKKNVYLIPLALKSFGIEDELFSSIAPQLSRSKVNFLFFGSIHSYKGLDILINAVNSLAKQRKDFTITIAGYTSDFSTYDRMIEAKELFDIRIELIPNEDISELFHKSDYLILPYRDVTQSGPLLISYKYNVPVVASDHPGFEDYIDANVNGFLFENESIDSLMITMNKILDLRFDERQLIRDNLAIKIENEFLPSVVALKYSKMFSSQDTHK